MNEEIQKVLQMSKEGILDNEHAAEMIAELVKKKSNSSRDWRKENTDDIADVISTLIGKTVDGAISMTGLAGKKSSHLEGFSPGDLDSNRFHMSKVYAPEGEDYLFQNNEIRMSHLKRFDFRRAEFSGNQIDASKIERLDIIDSKWIDSMLRASAIDDVKIEHSELHHTKVISSKFARVSIQGESTLENIKFTASSIKGLTIRDHSNWESSVVSGTVLSHVSSENSAVSGVEIQQSHLSNTEILRSTLSSVLLRGASLTGTKFVDCKLSDALFSGGHEKWSWKPWRGHGFTQVVFEGCHMDKVLFSDCTWRDVTIKNVRLGDLKIQGVNLTGCVLDGNDAFLAAVAIR